jgi:ribose transport system substrate-binding protein
MSIVKKLKAPLLALALSCAAMGVQAADVQLLPDGLLSPTSTEQTKPDAFKKAPPWRIGVSFAGVGNSWIVQMIEEMRHEASLDKDIGQFIFTEADWKPAKQVADVEDLLTKKIDLLIIGPISEAIGAPLIAKAVQQGIPVVTFGAYGNGTRSTTEIMGAGRVFGQQGGEFLCKVLKGKGKIWAFRGVAGVDEEQLRYDGFRKAVDACGLTVTNEVFGDWNYAKSKQLCENLVLSGQPVDGIWFSGAEMTRACIDVFKETGKPLVPMTGEANNGFLRVWKASGVKSVAPIFTPGLGAAAVRASVALLRGEPVYRSYFSAPPPITDATLNQYFRPDLNDAYWLPSTLPNAMLKQMFHR